MDNYQTYNNIRDLEQFGVLPLTGEACGVGMRILCDLTEEGVDLMRDFLRLEATNDAWNSKGTKSMMLPRALFEELWMFAHLRKGTKNVFYGGYVHQYQWTETSYASINETLKHPDTTWNEQAFAIDNEEVMTRLRKEEGVCFYISRTLRTSKAPGTGIDNTHGMSGRTV